MFYLFLIILIFLRYFVIQILMKKLTSHWREKQTKILPILPNNIKSHDNIISLEESQQVQEECYCTCEMHQVTAKKVIQGV